MTYKIEGNCQDLVIEGNIMKIENHHHFFFLWNRIQILGVNVWIWIFNWNLDSGIRIEPTWNRNRNWNRWHNLKLESESELESYYSQWNRNRNWNRRCRNRPISGLHMPWTQLVTHTLPSPRTFMQMLCYGRCSWYINGQCLLIIASNN